MLRNEKTHQNTLMLFQNHGTPPRSKTMLPLSCWLSVLVQPWPFLSSYGPGAGCCPDSSPGPRSGAASRQPFLHHGWWPPDWWDTWSPAPGTGGPGPAVGGWREGEADDDKVHPLRRALPLGHRRYHRPRPKGGDSRLLRDDGGDHSWPATLRGYPPRGEGCCSPAEG